MARNEEKHVTRLNRLLLQQQREENEKKNPKRPKLSTLNTAADIQKWIPSIKKDIDFNLKQSQVACYPDRKIEDFSQEIDRLKGEYHWFVRKLREFDRSVKVVPWTERAYDGRKRPATASCDAGASNTNKCDRSIVERRDIEVKGQSFRTIVTPILDQEDQYGLLYGYQSEPVKPMWTQPTQSANQPLQFKSACDLPTGEHFNSHVVESKPSAKITAFEKFNPTVFSDEWSEFQPNSLHQNSCVRDNKLAMKQTKNCLHEPVASRDTCGGTYGMEGSRTPMTKLLKNLVSDYGGDSSDAEDSEPTIS